MRTRYTPERVGFLREHSPGHSAQELADMFNSRFGTTASRKAIYMACRANGIGGLVNKGRFHKGMTAPNKGKTWDDLYTPEQQEHIRAHLYKPGNMSAKGMRYPVGSEREGKDGYVYVKVCESSRDAMATGAKSSQCWRLKHHLAWERENGKPVPDESFIVFADGDKRNFAPENLVCVSRGDYNLLNNTKMPRYYDAESLKACSALAKLKRAAKGRARDPRG
ncbi:HNH endonuclease signature motif containing protein [Gordonibacter sp. An230]|uniref:HNH endonuclease signature motif containing protein n=1 Tax=Gordonibacter sp. An230 TaxID=1965592 RepID=UPI0013A64D56|nr:HNH endonuclease signature motif containing protein [Gordonibacter sp. An230]